MQVNLFQPDALHIVAGCVRQKEVTLTCDDVTAGCVRLKDITLTPDDVVVAGCVREVIVSREDDARA